MRMLVFPRFSEKPALADFRPEISHPFAKKRERMGTGSFLIDFDHDSEKRTPLVCRGEASNWPEPDFLY